MGYRTGTIKLNENISIEYSGHLCKAEPDNGIMSDYFEIDDLEQISGDIFELLEFADSCKGYSLDVIEGKILEQIENER